MPRYVDAEKAHIYLNRTACKQIRLMPTADVAEVKHGKWKEHFSFDKWHYDCPFCDFGFAIGIRQESPPNYCENCGAKMDKKESEGFSDV